MEADAVSSKYAYQAEYIDLPVKVDYIQAYSISGSSLWFMGNVSAGKGDLCGRGHRRKLRIRQL